MANPASRSSLPFGFAIFLGAWLIFQIQPLMSKLILPWFGGTPQVWTVCLLFFQTVLFAGYVLAHLLERYCSRQLQAAIYVGFLAVAIVVSPVLPTADWRPTGPGDPTWQILLLLLRFIGLPYLLLAATGPLLQAWHHRSVPTESPYWLYALSNVGSLLGLLAYPFAIDILFPALTQVRLWTGCYVAYIVAAAACARILLKVSEELPEGTEVAARSNVKFGDRVLWFGLAMMPTILLAAVTSKLSTDISPVPFLWVVPLTLYLLSFILCFSGPGWYPRPFWGLALVAALAGASTLMTMGNGVIEYGSLWLQFLTYLGLLFCACMVCHGELVRLKPHQDRLTEFYLLMSAGGAAGGFLTGVIAPRMFPFHLELHLGMVGCAVLFLVVCFRDPQFLLNRGVFRFLWIVLLLAFSALGGAMWSNVHMTLENSYRIVRNFYGVLRISNYQKTDPEKHHVVLSHGGTRHGMQYMSAERRRMPTTYYGETSGIGLALRMHHPTQSRRVGVVGLGAGTLACYGKPGDEYDFFEINPLVIELAQTEFYYLKESEATCKIITGDARISLDQMPARGYDVLALDAFSSDAVPIHLLTEEAFEIYLKHMAPDGIIAAHISNRFFDMLPVMAGHAEKYGLAMAGISDYGADDDSTDSSTWVLLSRDANALTVGELGEHPHKDPSRVLHWTDAHSSLLAILIRKK
jgi:spermidine synthase